MKKIKLGIFGGSFSPPHLGHRKAAEAFASFAELDKLLIIPAFMPPHKELNAEASAEQRIDMCKLAFGDISKCEISDIEIKRGGKSYTYLTLQELKSEDKELYLLVGTDMLLTLDLWKNSQMIFSLCTVCYVRRECDGKLSSEIENKLELYRKNYGARILAIPSDAFEVSSTELRNKLSVGEDVTSYLNSAVFEYINERGLYS